MKVGEIMTKRVVTVTLDDRLSTVKEIFDHAKFHHLLVVEDGALCGVVSDRDLLKALSPNLGTAVESWKDAATLNKQVHQIVSRKLVTLGEEADVKEAARLFLSHNISCIPIVDAAMRPAGILSWRDILRTMF